MAKFSYHRTTSSKTNIILIVLDTHRADRLGFNGYTRGTSPNLDEFARSSIVFENAIAPAQWTIPSHASIFTGLPPSTHLVTQANSVLDERYATFAEILSKAGYETIGYCNNPLVGLIHNNLRRGFETFYNYSGTTPGIPHDFPDGTVYPFINFLDEVNAFIRKLVDPIQNKFATSTKLLVAATNPVFVPLWSSFVHFKGNTPRSIHDVTRFLKKMSNLQNSKPTLLFLNLMETHLPFLPPKEYTSRFAPYFHEERRASAFMRSFNNQAMHWLIPLKKPFLEFEAQTISDMYDAEVAYQDHLLGELLEQINSPAILDNSMVIITTDHGEMLGEHQFMGHGFGVYKELIQAPLLIHLPGQKQGGRVNSPVSLTRLFHTVLESAGISDVQNEEGVCTNTGQFSLLNEFNNQSPGPRKDEHIVISEAYAPQDAIKMMEKREPELIEPLHTQPTHRAVYSGERHKLYATEGIGEQLLTFDDIPFPSNALSDEQKKQITENLMGHLQRFIETSREGHPEGWAPAKVDLSEPLIEQRLRDLGYLA